MPFHKHQSPTLCVRTTKGISTVGEVAILSTSPIVPSHSSRSTTRRLLARLRDFRHEDTEERGRQTTIRRPTRRGDNNKGKARSGGDIPSGRLPRFLGSRARSSSSTSTQSSSSTSSPRSVQNTRPSPIHGISDLVFDPFYYTKLALSQPGEVSTSKRPGPLARPPALEGVDEVDEHDEEEHQAMDEDQDQDSDLEDNTLLWHPPSPVLLPPPLPEAPAYHHYEDDFPMRDDHTLILTQASGYASSSSSRTGSPTPPATPSFSTPFRTLDVDMDDNEFGDYGYDSDASSDLSSMDAQVDVVEEEESDLDDSEMDFDDAGMSTSRFLHRTAYETILTSTVHQYLGYMEDGGRVTVDHGWNSSEESLGAVERRAARLTARRGITLPRRYSSLMGVSMAIMKDRIGISTGF